MYFADGSVNRERGRARAAVVSEPMTLGWRLSNHCSTLQTELVASSAALIHARQQNNAEITVYTDSMSALQVLKQSTHCDNVRLVTHTLLQFSHPKEKGNSITFTWIPGHFILPFNEAAYAANKNALMQDPVQIDVQLSLQQLKRTARRSNRTRAET